MFANEYEASFSDRTRLTIVISCGLAAGILALFFLSLPNWELLTQLFEFPALIRASILVKVFSPLLCLLLIGGWVWIFLWKWGDSWFPRTIRQKERVVQAIPTRGTSQREVSSLQYKSETPTQEQAYPFKPLAVPPLFQLAHPSQAHQYTAHVLPNTPLPSTPDLSWCSSESVRAQEDEGSVNEKTAYVPSPQKDASHNEHTPVETHLSSPSIDISLLKRVRVQLCTVNGTTQAVKLRAGKNGIRLILLAYVAWRKGGAVDRDKMVTHIIGRGERRDSDTEQLSEVFDGIKKFLRADLRKAVALFNQDAEQQKISEKEVDFFSTEPGFYWLHPSCRVTDLETVEHYYTVITQARKDGLLDEKLDGTIPNKVVQACEQLLNAYTGDFLQDVIQAYPDEFGSWVREPVTLYRDYYLEALWLLALHESTLGKTFVADALSPEQNEEQRRYHSGRAAQRFREYALYAINSRLDNKVKFVYKAGRDGERVVAAERAIRRCIVELGKLGKTDMINQSYAAFKEKMRVISEGNWKPKPETERDVADAKKQTSAYRFSALQAETSSQH